DFIDTPLRRRNDTVFLVESDVSVRIGFIIVFGLWHGYQVLGDHRKNRVQLIGFFSWAGNDQRRTRFVDQDVVDFVDDGIVQRPLRLTVRFPNHVVAQIIETELIVGPVRDVGGIGLATFHGSPVIQTFVGVFQRVVVRRVIQRRELVGDHAYLQSER